MTKHALRPDAPAVAYYRVSRQQQAASGLGLEAQEASVAAFVHAHGLRVVASFTEVETGTRKRHRPVLAEAIAQAQREGAVLLIAKLDRLARNVHFVSGLLESRVRFVAVDMPDVDNLTVHILAAVAEKEAALIATRTREALAAAKARGKVLGKPENLTHAAQVKGAQANAQAAKRVHLQAQALACALHGQGLSLRAIGVRLTAAGHTPRLGGVWRPVQVARLIKSGVVNN